MGADFLERVILVTGMVHSGMTVAAWLLQQHPDITVAVEGDDAWMLEGFGLCAPADTERLRQFVEGCRCFVLVKTPWPALDQNWLTVLAPEIQIVYCWKRFGDIEKSWSRASERNRAGLQGLTIPERLGLYNEWMREAENVASRCADFNSFAHHNLIASPASSIDSLRNHLRLAPFEFDVSMISAGGDIKAHLGAFTRHDMGAAQGVGERARPTEGMIRL